MSKPLSYVLGRGIQASTRLNFQHMILKSHLRYKIHPKVDLPSAPRIADIGTGTGIWPVDVLRRLSGKGRRTQIFGFDISDDQFPHPNAFDAYPKDLEGKFDLVHVRAFVSILHESNIDAFMRGVSSLLKPGGFFQWVDLNPANVDITYVGRGPEPKPVHVQDAVEKYKTLNGAKVISQIDKYTQGYGLAKVAHDVSRFEGYNRVLWFQNEAMSSEDYYVRPAKLSGDPEKIREAEQKVAGFVEDGQSGAYISPDVFVRVMRKVQ